MDVLLIGEFSNLHNTLKKGLAASGHRAKIISSGSGFKNLPNDYSIKPRYSDWLLGNTDGFLLKKIYNIFAKTERGIRFYFLLNEVQKYDVIQLINERSIETFSFLEHWFLKKIIQKNKNVFVLSTWVDYITMNYYLKNKAYTSILQPYFLNKNLKKHYKYAFYYISRRHHKIHQLLYKKSRGFITTDLDYAIPLQENSKHLGLIPNPIDVDLIKYIPPIIEDKIIIFLGISDLSYTEKGIEFFVNALKKIKAQYHDQVEIIIAKNLPYREYIECYNKCHILLDQVFSNDQGFNALEAMAKGKVVFTGAEKNFLDYYNVKEGEIAINAKANVDDLVNKLSELIRNPEKIITIGLNARRFVEHRHHYIIQAQKYVEVWSDSSISTLP